MKKSELKEVIKECLNEMELNEQKPILNRWIDAEVGEYINYDVVSPMFDFKLGNDRIIILLSHEGEPTTAFKYSEFKKLNDIDWSNADEFDDEINDIIEKATVQVDLND